MGAKTYDVDLRHSGRCIAEKLGEGKGVGGWASGLALFLDGILKATDNANGTATKAWPWHQRQSSRWGI
jgi:hypothetical protein